MRSLFAAMIALLLLASPENAAAKQSGCSIAELSCEYLENPLGIDAEAELDAQSGPPWAATERLSCAGGQHPREPPE
jgi:hypothetical protein